MSRKDCNKIVTWSTDRCLSRVAVLPFVQYLLNILLLLMFSPELTLPFSCFNLHCSSFILDFDGTFSSKDNPSPARVSSWSLFDGKNIDRKSLSSELLFESLCEKELKRNLSSVTASWLSLTTLFGRSHWYAKRNWILWGQEIANSVGDTWLNHAVRDVKSSAFSQL